MTNEKLFRDKVDEFGLKLKYVAEYAGMTYQALLNKITNKSEFTTSEITALCNLFKIEELSEKESIFFALEVDCKSTEEE